MTELTTVPISIDSLEKWQLLELQGQLQVKPEGSHFDESTLGVMHVAQDADKNGEYRTELIIGKQMLEGKQSQLKKPLVVMRKVVNASDGSVEYKIVGLVKSKSLFTKRPVPLSPSSSQQQQKKATSPLSTFYKQSSAQDETTKKLHFT